MAEETGIEWCDSTWNPWIGCTKIAPACDFCYAAAIDKRIGGDHWGNVPRRRTSEHNWNEPRRWQRRAAEFFALNGHRRRVFCASMADVFDNQIDPAWRADLWALIRDCPDMDWLLLTKRPQNIAKMKPAFWDEIKGRIWLGTTVENQEHADQNIRYLIEHDSAVRFLSCEPLLGPIDLKRVAYPTIRYQTGIHYLDVLRAGSWSAGFGYRPSQPNEPQTFFTNHSDIHPIDWVIAGGESGPHARPSNPQWFRDLRDQCAAADVPFLYKQWGEWVSVSEVAGDGRHFKFEDGATVRRVGKKLAGRTLDHVTHDGYPA